MSRSRSSDGAVAEAVGSQDRFGANGNGSRATLSLGSNVGDKSSNIARALERLDLGGARILRRSADYRTEPWGPVEQDWFVNACALTRTELAPHDLLRLCHAVEEELGRTREVRWGPRTIDIDILTYDALTLHAPSLTIPHPRVLERAFVLFPLAEIAPDLVIAGVTAAQAAARIPNTGVVRLDPAAAPRRRRPT